MNQQRTALITGSSRGIGRGIALAFAQAGYNVIINYLKNQEEANKTLSLAGQYSRAITIQADIKNPQDVQRMYKTAQQNFGFVDTLINNAGINKHGLLIDQDESDMQEIINTNICGAMRCSKAFLPDMINHNFGRIINISSIWGLSGASNEVSYSTTKSALIGFTKALSKEVLPMGITVNAIAPGLIDTDMTRCFPTEVIDSLIKNILANRIGQPSDIAHTALFLAHPASNYISGQTLPITGEYIPAVQ